MARQRWPTVTRKMKGREYKYFAVRFTDPGTGKGKLRYFASEKEARSFHGEVTRKVAQGMFHPRAHKATVTEVAKQWRAIHLPRVRATTAANYRSALDNYILKRWGATKLVDVKTAQIELWRDEIAKKVGPSTVRNVLQTFGAIMKHAQRDDLIARNPVALVGKPSIRSRRRESLKPEQVRHLIAWCDAKAVKLEADAQAREMRAPIWPRRVGVFVTLAAYCGLREGEIFGLRWSDLDLKAGLLNVEQQYTHGAFGPVKTDAGKRTVGLDRDLIATLRAWKLRQGRAGTLDLVLPALDGTPMSASNFLNREFRRALKEAGLPSVTAHSLRHSFVGMLKSSGVPLAVAREVAGHANISTTAQLYGDVDAEARIAAAGLVSDRIAGRPDKQRTNHSKTGEETRSSY